MKKLIALAITTAILPLAHANNVYIHNDTNKTLGFQVSGFCTPHLLKSRKSQNWLEADLKSYCRDIEPCQIVVYSNDCPSKDVVAVIDVIDWARLFSWNTYNNVDLSVGKWPDGKTTTLTFSH